MPTQDRNLYPLGTFNVIDTLLESAGIVADCIFVIISCISFWILEVAI